MTLFVLFCALITPSVAAKAPPSEVLLGWLDCEDVDCQGALEAVLAYDDGAVPSLAATLHDGLSEARTREATHAAGVLVADLEAAAAASETKLPLGRDALIAEILERANAAHRVRAARALGAIGNAEAKLALIEALELPLRTDEVTAVKDALAHLGS